MNKSNFLTLIFAVVAGVVFSYISTKIQGEADDFFPQKLCACHFNPVDYIVCDTFSYKDLKKMSNPPVKVNMKPVTSPSGYVRTPETAASMALGLESHPYYNSGGVWFIPRFDIFLYDSIWVVNKSLVGPKTVYGGSYMAEINRKTGEIIGIERYK